MFYSRLDCFFLTWIVSLDFLNVGDVQGVKAFYECDVECFVCIYVGQIQSSLSNNDLIISLSLSQDEKGLILVLVLLNLRQLICFLVWQETEEISAPGCRLSRAVQRACVFETLEFIALVRCRLSMSVFCFCGSWLSPRGKKFRCISYLAIFSSFFLIFFFYLTLVMCLLIIYGVCVKKWKWCFSELYWWFCFCLCF